jgi:hypothetical protein
MTRTGITQTLPSKSVEGLTMFFKCLLDLHSLTLWIGLSFISLCQHRTPRMIVHSSACFSFSTTMVEIGKWTFKLTRLVGNSSQPFSSFVNSQVFIHNRHLPFIVHFFNHAPFLLCFEQDLAHEYRVQFLHYFLFHRLNQALHPFLDFIQQFAPGPSGQWRSCWQTLNIFWWCV